MSLNKAYLADLIEKLPEKDVPLVADLIKRLIHHPNDQHISFDDEQLTDDDREAIDEAHRNLQAGRTIKFEDILHELQD